MQQTIPVNDGYISSYVGSTPSTGPFAVDFPFFSLNDVYVSLKPDGVLTPTQLIRGADYDITGVATDDGSFSSGSITLYIAVVTTTVIRSRSTPVERLSNFPLQGFFSRLSLNAELNRITVWMQELVGMLGSVSEGSIAHAPIASPLFIGNPRGPTPAPGDNDTSLATTAFVQAALAAIGAAIPPGVITDFAGAAAPTGWLICLGQTVNRTTYAALFAIIGTTYNVGGEAGTDFRLPDLRGRVTAGKETVATRLTVAVSGIDGGVLAAAGGLQSATASTTSSGSANLSVTGFTGADNADVLVGAGGLNAAAAGHAHATVTGNATGTVGVTGTSSAFSVVQPTMILNKIIKT